MNKEHPPNVFIFYPFFPSLSLSLSPSSPEQVPTRPTGSLLPILPLWLGPTHHTPHRSDVSQHTESSSSWVWLEQAAKKCSLENMFLLSLPSFTEDLY